MIDDILEPLDDSPKLFGRGRSEEEWDLLREYQTGREMQLMLLAVTVFRNREALLEMCNSSRFRKLVHNRVQSEKAKRKAKRLAGNWSHADSAVCMFGELVSWARSHVAELKLVFSEHVAEDSETVAMLHTVLNALTVDVDELEKAAA